MRHGINGISSIKSYRQSVNSRQQLTAMQSRVNTMRGPPAKPFINCSSCARSGSTWSGDSSPL